MRGWNAVGGPVAVDLECFAGHSRWKTGTGGMLRRDGWLVDAVAVNMSISPGIIISSIAID